MAVAGLLRAGPEREAQTARGGGHGLHSLLRTERPGDGALAVGIRGGARAADRAAARDAPVDGRAGDGDAVVVDPLDLQRGRQNGARVRALIAPADPLEAGA